MLAQEGELHHGGEVDCELLVTGGDGAAALRPSDSALDCVAPAVALSVEALRAALAHVAALARWDDVPHAAVTQTGEERSVAVGLVAS